MSNREIIIRKEFVAEIKTIIGQARESAIRSVDFQRVLMYWHIGQRIFEEEQQGKERAEYGTYLIKNLAKELEPEFGSGFSVRILEISRQFYRTYPNANTLYSQLNWSQYRLLLRSCYEITSTFFGISLQHLMPLFTIVMTKLFINNGLVSKTAINESITRMNP